MTLAALAYRTQEDHIRCLETIQAAKETPLRKDDAATHDLDLQILASVLRGLTLEQLSWQEGQIENTARAEELLNEADQVYRGLPTDPPPPVPEAQRYIEVGMARLAFLAQTSSAEQHKNPLRAKLSAQRNYFTATHTFSRVPPVKRMLIYHAHLTTLLSHFMSTTTTLKSDADPPTDIETSSSDIARTFAAYEDLLLTTPSLVSFPRAGDPSHNIYAYMALLYAFWDLGHLQSQWVVDSLYRALTRTFASQRLHRYLVMVLSSMALMESDRRVGKKYADDAIRNLRLYIKLFEKSRETDQVAVQREVNAFRRKREGAAAVPEVDDPDDESNALETDEDFCRTACMGTRLLLSEAGKDNKQEQEDDRLDLIKEAFDVSEKALKVLRKQQIKENVGKDRLTSQDCNVQPQALPVPPGPDSQRAQQDSGVVAEVSLWFGVAQAEWALAEADPETARSKAKTALRSLSTAEQCLPHLGHESSGIAEPKDSYLASFIRSRVLYSLAYAELEVRDVPAAIATAKKAVQAIRTNPFDRDTGLVYRIWHLLVLAVSAQKDWFQARQIAEEALTDSSDSEGGSVGETTRFFDNPYASEEGDSLDKNTKVKIVTPGDAPHDPMTVGSPTMQVSGDRGQSESASSSFINPSRPASAVNGHARDYATGEASHDLPSAVRKRKISQADSAKSAREHGLMTHRTSTPWDDLEAEVDLYITRNRCIEAVEGPEVALNDLQRNVMPRFSQKREELEDEERRRLAAITAASMTQPAVSFPYASSSMQNSPSMHRKLESQRAHTVSGTDTPGRARSIIGTFSLRHRSRTNSTQHHAPGDIPRTQITSPPQPGL